MAHYRGIFGFEGGDKSGVLGSGGSVTTLAARPGGSGYGLRISTINTGNQITLPVPTTGGSLGLDYDVKVRVAFRINAYPSSTNFKLFRCGVAGFPMVQLSTTGQIRLVSPGNFSTGYSSGSLTLDTWYYADVRAHGWLGDGSSFGRRKETMAVYDTNGNLFFSASNPDQQDTTNGSPIPILGDYNGVQGDCATVNHVNQKQLFVNAFYAGFAGAWDTLCAKGGGNGNVQVTGYNFVAPDTTFNTTFDLSTDPAFTTKSVALDNCHLFAASALGKAYEVGTMLPFGDEMLGYQWQAASELVMSTLDLCDTSSATRSIDYDDIWFDVKTGDDVDGDSAFPTGTHISRVRVTAQGPSDEFTTAGNFSAVAETPLASGTVSGAYGLTTDYEHEQIDGTVVGIQHVRMYMNASVNAASGTGELILGGVEYPIIVGATIAADATTIIADRIGDYNRSAFNEATYGAQNTTVGKVLTIGNMYMEVLNGPTVTIAPFQFDVCEDWASQPIEPGEDTTTPVDDLFPECTGT